jgi:hypothetical protein
MLSVSNYLKAKQHTEFMHRVPVVVNYEQLVALLSKFSEIVEELVWSPNVLAFPTRDGVFIETLAATPESLTRPFRKLSLRNSSHVSDSRRVYWFTVECRQPEHLPHRRWHQLN